MNAKARAPLFLLACCAAWLVWLAVRGATAPDPRPVSLRTPPERVEVAAAPEAAGARQRGPTASAQPERTALPTSDAALASIVRGRLIDGSARPRAGIVVQITSWSLPDASDRDDLAFPSGGRPVTPRPAATTDVHGAFQLPLAVGRSGELSLRGADFAFAAEAPRADGKDGDQDLGDLVVDRAGTLRGVVLDQAGQPVAGVGVTATDGVFPIGTWSSTTTAADGTFTVGNLRAGSWTLRTSSERFLPTVERFVLAREEQRSDLIVLVRPGRAVAGQVVDDRGRPVEGIRVQSRRQERSATLLGHLEAPAATATDQHGCFTLSGLADALVTLRAFGPGHSVETVADVPVGTSDLLIRLERQAVIEGVLLAADGTPIGGSVVAALAPGDGSIERQPERIDGMQLASFGASATTDAAGRFRIASAPAGSLLVVARGRGHRPVLRSGLHAQPGQTLDGIRLVANRGATVRVRVVDASGEPVGGAGLRIARAANGNDPHVGRLPPLALAETGAGGTVAVTGLPPGTVTVDATHAAFGAAPTLAVVVPDAGEIDARLTLQQPGFAAIEVLGADGAASPHETLRVTGPATGKGGGPSRRATTDAEGKALVGPLSPGAYEARLLRSSSGVRLGDAAVAFGDDDTNDIGSTTQPFRVLAGQTTRVELRRPVLATVHGVVRGVDGPIAGCVVSLTEPGAVDLAVPGLGGLGLGCRSVTTGADGSFAFADVESGTWWLRHGRPEQVVKGVTALAVPPGRRDLRHDLALHTGRLRVQVWDAGTNAPIRLADVELIARVSVGTSPPATAGGAPVAASATGVSHARTTEHGWAEIEQVPVGDYVVHLRHEGHAAKTIEAQRVHLGRTTECGRVTLGLAPGSATSK
jgi:hypothetical protein